MAPPSANDPFADDEPSQSQELDLEATQTMSDSHSVRLPPPAHWPPPTTSRSMARQSSILFARLTQRPQDIAPPPPPAPPPAPSTGVQDEPGSSTTPQRRTTRPSSSMTPADKGKGKAPASGPPEAPSPSRVRVPLQRLESLSIVSDQAKQCIPALKRDIRTLADEVERDRTARTSELADIRETLQVLTETTTAIHSQVVSQSPTADVQELDERISLLARSVEENEELASREASGLHQREDAMQDELRELSRTVSTVHASLSALSNSLRDLQSSHAVPAPRDSATAMPPPDVGALLPSAPQPAPSRALFPAPTHTMGAGPSSQMIPRFRASDAGNPRPQKKIRPMRPPQVLGPGPVAGPVLHLPQAAPFHPPPPPMPLPGQPNDHPAIVRFGRVIWDTQSAVLRQQVYMAGRAAWDAFPGLFPSISDVTLQVDDREYAEITFPSLSLARTFVDAWQRNRASAGEWRRLQVHLL